VIHHGHPMAIVRLLSLIIFQNEIGLTEMAANADANEPITYKNVKDRPDTFCHACKNPIQGLP